MLFLVALGITYAGQANATDAKNNYMILGPGAYSCQKIVGDLTTDAKRNNPASVIVYSNWLAGNLTAYNRGTKDTYSILGSMGFADAFKQVVGYCQTHPAAIYASAVDHLVATLRPDRFKTVPTVKVPKSSPKDSGDDDDNDDSDEMAH